MSIFSNSNKKVSLSIIILVILISILSGLAYALFFMPNNGIIEVEDISKTKLVVEDKLDLTLAEPKIVDNEILLPFDVVKKYIDPNIYWDESLKKVTITTENKVIRMKTDSLDALVNNKSTALKLPVSIQKETIYIPIEFLSNMYGIEIKHIKDSNVVIIDFINTPKLIGEAKANIVEVRRYKSIHSPMYKKYDLKKNPQEKIELSVFEDSENWYKVRTPEGFLGYVDKNQLNVKKLETSNISTEKSTNNIWRPERGKINLVWEMMYGKRPDLSKMPKINGLDVVSPTWFQVANEQGTLINRADIKYVEWAHQNGYKVWALLANDFNSQAMTKKLLNNTDARENVIRQLLSFVALYKIDGINLDFENISKDDKNALTQFVRELTPLLKEQGVVVSMDVTVPDGSDSWSLCYDRKALGQIVDYIMVMTYDQYWSGSPKSGSVAQLSWVELNVKKMLDLVPKEKLILGLPFYTRLWKEELGPDGKLRVTSQPMTMESAKKAMKDNDGQIRWEEESGQFYGEYKKDGLTYKVWIEDENSINLKSALVLKYELAGSASWSKTYEVPAVWNTLNSNLKGFENYQAWLDMFKGKNFAYEN